jgi:hypothetical protein
MGEKHFLYKLRNKETSKLQLFTWPVRELRIALSMVCSWHACHRLYLNGDCPVHTGGNRLCNSQLRLERSAFRNSRQVVELSFTRAAALLETISCAWPCVSGIQWIIMPALCDLNKGKKWLRSGMTAGTQVRFMAELSSAYRPDADVNNMPCQNH